MVPSDFATIDPGRTATAPLVAAKSPAGRVFLSARWQALAMLNYEVDPAILRPLVPRGTELDMHEGRTYVSVVGFLFLGTRVLGWPIPLHRNFEEVNLRFYVRREVRGEERRAVAFVKEIVPRWAIATTARWAYNEPYIAAAMRHSIAGPVGAIVRDEAGFVVRTDPLSAATGLASRATNSVAYCWRFRGRWNRLSLTHAGEPAALPPGSHEEFIAEHYWGYCAQRDRGTVEYRVAHPPWRVWRGEDAHLDCDVAALYGPQFAPLLTEQPASAFLADGSEVAVMRPTRFA